MKDKIIKIIFAIIILNLLDSLFTIMIIDTGIGFEVNPISRYLLEFNPLFFIIFKNILIVFLSYFIFSFYKKLFIRLVSYISFLIYSIAILNHFIIILSYFKAGTII